MAQVGAVIQSMLLRTALFKERPLIIFFLFYAAGIILGDLVSLPSRTSVLVFMLFPLTGLFLAFQFKRYLSGYLCLNLCILLAGLVCASPPIPPNPTQTTPKSGYLQEKRVYQGYISQTPQMLPSRIRYVLSEVRLLGDGTTSDIPGKVLLTAYVPDIFHYGDYVQFRARLTPPRNFHNPGGFDYRKYLHRQGIFHRASINNRTDMILIRRNLGNILKTGIETYRTRLREFITDHTSSPKKEIILALLLGEQKTIPDDLRDRFNRTGTSHIITISGFHVGMIAFFSVFFFRSILNLFPRTLLMWNATKVSYALSLPLILLYAGVAGMGISVTRATIMVVVLMTALMIRRPKDLLNALALAAILILVLSPSSLFDPSFQLSFAAVTAILYIPPKLQGWYGERSQEDEPVLRRLLHRWGKKFYLFLLVSISATLGTLPIIAHHFQTLSTVVLPTNMAVIPFLGILTTPLCLLMIIVYPLWESFCRFLVQGAGYLIQISVFFVNFFSSLPNASILIPSPTWLQIIAYYLLLGLLTLYGASFIKRRSTRERGVTPSMPFPVHATLLVLIPILAFTVLYGYLSAESPKFLKLTVLDVGQGNCALVQIPGGHTMLIDGGGFEGSTFDVGRHVVAPFLLRERIRKIDFVVLTHPHPDHLNGLIHILRHFTIGEVWSNGDPSPCEPYGHFREIIEEKRLVHRILSYGQKERRIGLLQVKVLNPLPSDSGCIAVPYTFNETNNRSLVLHLRFGDIGILLPGDIAAETEKRLTGIPEPLKSDIILAPHHGGRTSSTPAFLDRVRPSVAIFSCGFDNRYKHPHPEVISRYRERGAKIYQTDHDGAVTLLTDGTSIWDGQGIKILPSYPVAIESQTEAYPGKTFHVLLLPFFRSCDNGFPRQNVHSITIDRLKKPGKRS
ncbi:MAG: DNA internalization-related competence protein ComEC/Rec2 [Syntrophales bacterium]|nr:DNA internalization-related competence protein ComEC/Rec2 [Syntrophales bacterium]